MMQIVLDFESALIQISYDGQEGTTGYGLVLDIGKGPNKFAIDYYSGASIYKRSFEHRDTSGDINTVSSGFNNLHLGTSGFMLGYRRHTSSGFYVGGGIMFMEPSVEGEIKLTTTSPTQGLSFPTMSFSSSVNYDQVTPITLTLGYDHSYNNGLVLGVHFMRTASSQLNIDGADNVIDDFYLQSLSFGIGYEWK